MNATTSPNWMTARMIISTKTIEMDFLLIQFYIFKATVWSNYTLVDLFKLHHSVFSFLLLFVYIQRIYIKSDSSFILEFITRCMSHVVFYIFVRYYLLLSICFLSWLMRQWRSSYYYFWPLIFIDLNFIVCFILVKCLLFPFHLDISI